MDGSEQGAPSVESLARLIRHPLRMHVLFKYIEGVTSPVKVAAGLREPLNVVSYHTKVLHRSNAIELVRTERRRGAWEHFYRAILPGDIADDAWVELPIRLRRVLVRGAIDGGMREAADALPRGGMDGAWAHVSRSYFALDEQGRRELAMLLRNVLVRANALDVASRERNDPDNVPCELVIMSFERASSP